MHPTELFKYKALLLTIVFLLTITVVYILFYFRMQRTFRKAMEEARQKESNMLESERKRISLDLHDDLGPSVAAIKHKLDCMQNLSGKNKDFHDQASVHLNKTIQKIRVISNNFFPQLLDHYGLRKTIEAFFREIDFQSLKADIIISDIPAFKTEVQVQVFRIVQEITNNAIKHSSAANFSFNLSVQGNFLLLDIADDGIGFNYHPVFQENLGTGIRNIESRLHDIHATYNLVTAPGKGTRYIISIPLHLINKNENEKNQDTNSR